MNHDTREEEITEAHLLLRDWKPKSTLVLDAHTPEKARYPVINVHTHLGSVVDRSLSVDKVASRKSRALGHRLSRRQMIELKPRYHIEELVRIMDACNVEKLVDLDGISPIEEYSKIYRDCPDRFIVFYVLSFEDIGNLKFGEKRASELEEAVSHGARGLKVHKALGLTVRDKANRIVPVDDLRFDPIWEKAGELGVPVLVHSSDPVAFFLPVDQFNPYYVTLRYYHRNWSFYGPRFPEKMEILKQRDHVVEKHPKTIFIGAHYGNYPENLGYVSSLLDRYDNFYIDCSRMAWLGLQPYSARKHLIKYQDRILFGTDSVEADHWRTYFRFLETEDEYFDGRPWGDRIYAVNLPDNVLEKIYRKNAERILPKN